MGGLTYPPHPKYQKQNINYLTYKCITNKFIKKNISYFKIACGLEIDKYNTIITIMQFHNEYVLNN